MKDLTPRTVHPDAGRGADREIVEEVLGLLGRGRAAGLRGADLSEAVGETIGDLVHVHPRRIGEAVVALVEAGVPVCGSAASGYYVAETREEAEAEMKSLRGRFLSIARRCRAFRRAARQRDLLRDPNQIHLFSNSTGGYYDGGKVKESAA